MLFDFIFDFSVQLVDLILTIW